MESQGVRDDPRLPRALFRAATVPGEAAARIGYFLPKDDETALAYEKRRRLGPSLDDDDEDVKTVGSSPPPLVSLTDEEARSSNSTSSETTRSQVPDDWTRNMSLRLRRDLSKERTHRWMDGSRSVLEVHTTLLSTPLRLCASVDQKYVPLFSLVCSIRSLMDGTARRRSQGSPSERRGIGLLGWLLRRRQGTRAAR